MIERSFSCLWNRIFEKMAHTPRKKKIALCVTTVSLVSPHIFLAWVMHLWFSSCHHFDRRVFSGQPFGSSQFSLHHRSRCTGFPSSLLGTSAYVFVPSVPFKFLLPCANLFIVLWFCVVPILSFCVFCLHENCFAESPITTCCYSLFQK